MLTTTTFECGVGACTASPTIWHALAERILDASIVNKPNQQASLELLAHLKALPPDTQLLWSDLIRKRFAQRRSGTSSCQHSAALTISLDDADGASCPTCSMASAGVTAALTHAEYVRVKAANARGIRPGDRCLDALNDMFAPTVNYANRAIVLDRFGVVDALRGEQAYAGSSGLRRFIELCAASDVDSLDLYASNEGSQSSPAELAEQLTAALSSTKYGSTICTLHVVTKKKARDEIHDRWVGLSWSSSGQASWTLGKGLSQLSGTTAKSSHTFTRVADDCVSTVLARIENSVELSVRLT